jgi:hypothetical protein
MRISVDKKDTGYSKSAFLYKVKLDGEFIDQCFTADEELGEAHCYKLNSKGKLKLTNKRTIETHILKGKVEIIRP